MTESTATSTFASPPAFTQTEHATLESPAHSAAPVTPPREKLRRKSKPRSPAATTPTKKLRGTNSSSTPTSPKSPVQGYYYITATTSTKAISNMTKVNLVNEIVKNQLPLDDIMTVEKAETLSVQQLIVKATEIRDTLRKTTKRTGKRLKFPIIRADTPDSAVTEMTKEVTQATYVSCMRRMNQKVDKNSINLFSMDDFVDGIMKYRKHLITKEREAITGPLSKPTAADPNGDTRRS